jgi:hypothetical protein
MHNYSLVEGHRQGLFLNLQRLLFSKLIIRIRLPLKNVGGLIGVRTPLVSMIATSKANEIRIPDIQTSLTITCGSVVNTV